MKKVILITILLYSLALGQSWNNPVTTTISASSLERMDLFTNKDGNHLLIKNSNGNIIYYNINSQGTVDNNKTETLESNGDYPAITGSNNKIYAIYKSGNYIKGKYSTNGGTDWTALSNINVGSNACNGIDAVYENDRGVHLVYAMRDNGNYFETYYYLLNNDDDWVDYKNVTDYGTEVGGVPSVTFSNNRVHVSYNSGEATPPYIGVGVSKSRDKVGSTWQNPQLVSDGEFGFATSREKLQVRSNKLFCIFYDAWVDLGQYGWRIQVKSRDLTGTYWPSSYTTIFYYGEPRSLLGTETTANGNLNVVHNNIGNILHKSYNGTQWSEFEVSPDYLNYEMQHHGFSTVSNDLFVVWKPNNSNNIKYRQYDAAPLAPQGLAVQPYQQGNNRYAKLTWQLNNEPDVFIKQNNAYEIERRINFLGNWGTWQVIATRSGNVTEFIDNETVGVGDAEVYIAEYRMRARDYNNNISGYSSSVSIEFQRFVPTAPGGSGGWANKSTESSGNNISYEYNLTQNYPNPFNPVTSINYSVKAAGLVTLKVYDMLGTEVASLVNERQEAGNYSVEFKAGNLPSGIYVYRLSTNNYVDTKKLILLK